MQRILLLILSVVLLVSFEKREKKWVAIGDSITYLNDHLNETDGRVTKGYMTLVQERLPAITYVNKGYNGWTSGNIAERFDSLYIPPADIYTVFLGTNDWWQGRPVGRLKDYQQNTGNGTIYGSFRIIIDKLKYRNRKAELLLITPMQRTDFVYLFNAKNNAWGSYREKNGQTLEQVANAIREIGAEERIKVIDLFHDAALGPQRLVKFKRMRDPLTGQYRNYRYPWFQDIPFDPEKDAYPYPPEAADLTYDGLHPSDSGYALIAKRISDVFRKIK